MRAAASRRERAMARPSVPLDTLGRALPPPCPSECIDMTPPDMWAAYWALSPDGTAGIPASAPFALPDAPEALRKAWALLVKQWRGSGEKETPKFWKGYWGKFISDKAEEGRRNGIPDVRLGERFWEEYAARHPDGHWEDPSAQTDVKSELPLGHMWEEGKHGYVLIRGQLCFRHPNGNTYPATGVDQFE